MIFRYSHDHGSYYLKSLPSLPPSLHHPSTIPSPSLHHPRDTWKKLIHRRLLYANPYLWQQWQRPFCFLPARTSVAMCMDKQSTSMVESRARSCGQRRSSRRGASGSQCQSRSYTQSTKMHRMCSCEQMTIVHVTSTARSSGPKKQRDMPSGTKRNPNLGVSRLGYVPQQCYCTPYLVVSTGLPPAVEAVYVRGINLPPQIWL
jgi:hypothetical protein